MKLVSFVIVSEKLSDINKNCLNSIYAQGGVENNQVIIICREKDCIDNYQDEIVICNNFNFSLEQGFNQGLLRATSEYICFLTGEEIIYHNLITDIKKAQAKGVFPDIFVIPKIAYFEHNDEVGSYVFKQNYYHKKFQPNLGRIVSKEQLILLPNKLYSRNFLLKEGIFFDHANSGYYNFIISAYIKAASIVGLEGGYINYEKSNCQSCVKNQGVYLNDYSNRLQQMGWIHSSEMKDGFIDPSILESVARFLHKKNVLRADQHLYYITIIVPVYNVEDYIGYCLKSLLEQSLNNIKIICVNDGSKDDSLFNIQEISKDCAYIDIIDINVASGHPGTPRNLALCVANSEYIAFVDSDDWISRDMFKELYNEAKKSNLDICSTSGYFRVLQNEAKNFEFSYISKRNQNDWNFLENKFFSNIWNRIYKLELLRNNHVYFPSLYLSEDLCFSAIAHYYALNTGSIPGSFYHYRYNLPNSTTDNRTGEQGLLIVDDFEKQLRYLSSHSLNQEFFVKFLQKQLDSFWYTHDRLHNLLRPLFKVKLKLALLPFKDVFQYDSLSPDSRGRLKNLFSSEENEIADIHLDGLDLYKLQQALQLQISGQKNKALEMYCGIKNERLKYFNAFCLALSMNNLVEAKIFLKRLESYPGDHKKCSDILIRHYDALQPIRYNNRNFPQQSDLMLSVIIPVHNSDKYLDQCLISVTNQSYKNLEIIIINDGSTDGSAEIIRKHSAVDPRVVVIDNKVASGNPGTPRNQAINIARGDYLTFVDSDDYIDVNYYRNFIDSVQNNKGVYADVIFASGYHDFSDIKPPKIVKYDNKQFNDLSSVFYRYHQSFTIWDKIYKTSFIKDNNILLAELPAAVDVPFVFKCYIAASSIGSCENNFGYYYRRESDSSVTKNRRKKSNCEFEFLAYQQVVDWVDENEMRSSFRSIIDFKKISSYLYTLTLVSDDYKDDFYKRVRSEFLTFNKGLMLSLLDDAKQGEKKSRFLKVLATPKF